MEKHKKSTKLIISIIILVLGVGALAGGAVYFILDQSKKPDVRDAEFITKVGKWTMLYLDTSLITNCGSNEIEEPTNCIDSPEPTEGPSNVIWDFTEIGKGTLTTNNHIDDHEFKWSLEGNTLKVETEWLYDLYNEYTYELNQEESTLTLTDPDGETYKFIPATTKDEAEE